MLISRLNRRIRKNPIKNGRRLAAIHCDGIETARDDGRRRRRRYGGDEGEKSETDDGARPYLSGTSVNAMISAAGARPVRGRARGRARGAHRKWWTPMERGECAFLSLLVECHRCLFGAVECAPTGPYLSVVPAYLCLSKERHKITTGPGVLLFFFFFFFVSSLTRITSALDSGCQAAFNRVLLCFSSNLLAKSLAEFYWVLLVFSWVLCGFSDFFGTCGECAWRLYGWCPEEFEIGGKKKHTHQDTAVVSLPYFHQPVGFNETVAYLHIG